MGLAGLESPQIVDGVEIRQAGVVGDVELRDIKAWQQGFGDGIQGSQGEALLAFQAHLAVAKALGVLLQGSQFGQGVITFEQLLQRFACRIGQVHFHKFFQAFTLD